ncbi:unnamed protein product [Rotaria sp. Silwood2]|nr:unnamed protein product [Rotaria sp. Silwood2]CAF4491481.1 unnamed protein product [Rotaria sp. Silwood2]CAF4591357.1 unnamed protein product [Rotaria sp. Silwood2]
MIAIPIQSPVVLQRQKTGEARQEVISSTATANSSATTCSTGISTLTTTNSMTKWKNDFVVELLKLKNQLLNNPFFSVERYKQTIELINNAKLKSVASTSLLPSIFNNLFTEEESQKELGLPTCDTYDSDQYESDLESDEDEIEDVDESNVNAISYQNTDMKLDQTLKPLNDRIFKTGEILPDIDRGLTDARNVLAATMKIKHDKYKLGTEQGVLHDYYSFHQLSKAPRTPTL